MNIIPATNCECPKCGHRAWANQYFAHPAPMLAANTKAGPVQPVCPRCYSMWVHETFKDSIMVFDQSKAENDPDHPE